MLGLWAPDVQLRRSTMELVWLAAAITVFALAAVTAYVIRRHPHWYGRPR